MSDQNFVHLHVHTEYSLLDGLSRIEKLVERAKELNMPSLAITDHGTMFGVMDFYRACKGADIKPIIGVEAYLARRSMQDRDPKFDKKPYHMLLLAQNQTGYKNLLKIASAAQLEGYYYRPRIDRDFLAAHAEGIIATSGCLAAQIPTMIMEGRDDEARELIGWYQDVFGKDNFYLELQQHDIPELETLNKWIFDYSKSSHTHVPLVATNDVHYVLDSDYDPHDTLLCIQTGALKTETDRLRMSDPSYHLTTPDEMYRFFGDLAPSALSNTLTVAEMCEINLDDREYHLPVFPVPTGYDSSSYLRYLCEKGMGWRYDSHADDAEMRARLDRELGIIGDMGFNTYFLIVWDLCQFARHADIWWNVRGSGAGSLVAYSLGITNIDPIQNNLLFERFLNPGRVSMPDIDIDFPDDRREEMIYYTARKYGEDKVAAIITFGTLGAKAAVRDVGRALNVPLEIVNQAARLIPTEPKPKPIMTYVEENPELKQLVQSSSEIRQIVDIAQHLQGVNRHASTHAAGVIVADKPLVEYLPLHRPTKIEKADKEDEEGKSENPLKAVTQFPMETCESIGLLKIDFLGLSTLTIMRKACDLIEQHHGIKFTMDNIPYRPTGDPEVDRQLQQTFALIGRGETVGIFQVEGTGMQQMLRDMRPTKFEHIVAAVSLYRPGPLEFIPTYNKRLRGEEAIEYRHPSLKPILEETMGICIAGDSLVLEVETGKRYRVDEIQGKVGEFHIQGVGKDLEPAVGRVTHWQDNGVRDVYRLSLRNGATIKATANHRFLTEQGWKELDELQVGDFVATPPYLIEPGQPISAHLVQRAAETLGVAETLALSRTNQLTNVIWEEIHSIEYAGAEPVYDLTVEGLHNFVANNVIVHNCVYQEQIMQIAGDIFGYELGEADLMRRAVSKKKEKDLKLHRDIFLERGSERGLDADTTNKIFDDIEFFANYGFNKCLVYDTEIVDADTGRLVKIGDLATGKVHIEQTVTCDTDTLRLKPGKITAVMENGVKPVYRLTTQLGRQIEATDNHPFYTFNGWRNLVDLKTGDQIAVTRRVSVEGQETTIIHSGLFPRMLWASSDPDTIETDWVFELNSDWLAYIVSMFWYYDASGYFGNIPTFEYRFSCPVSSHKIAHQLQHLLLRFGIIARISQVESDNLWHVEIIEARSRKHFVERILSKAPQAAVDWSAQVAPWYKPVTTPVFDDVEIDEEGDIYWDKIVSIEYVGEQPTYDLTIEGTHNFIANDILVHNSHAADYAVITCQTAYLKTLYPAEYMTALLSVHRDDITKITTFLNECRRTGIPVLPPDVNYSALDFDIQAQADGTRGIRFGLVAIKNAGEAAVMPIINERREGGPFASLEDFCRRVDLRLVQKRTLESLIKVGALDSFGTRWQLADAASLERIVNFSGGHHHAKEIGQMSMFGETTGMDDHLGLSEAEEVSEREMLNWEKELLGLYVSGRPADKIRELLARANNTVDVAEIRQSVSAMNGKLVSLAGEVTSLRKLVTKQGQMMGIAQVEDWHPSSDTIEVVLFPRTWDKFGALVEEGNVLVFGGKVDNSRGDVQIICDTVTDKQNFVLPAETEYVPPSNPEPPLWMDESFDSDLDMPAPPPVPEPEPEVTTVVAPATQGAAAVRTPALEPQLVAEARPIPSINWMDAEAPDVTDLDLSAFETAEAPERWLMIYFQRSEDAEKDRRRLRRLHGVLTKYPGKDRFSIVLEDQKQSFKMEFPNDTTAYCDDLLSDLVTIVGEINNVEVFDRPQ